VQTVTQTKPKPETTDDDDGANDLVSDSDDDASDDSTVATSTDDIVVLPLPIEPATSTESEIPQGIPDVIVPPIEVTEPLLEDKATSTSESNVEVLVVPPFVEASTAPDIDSQDEVATST